jgi:hypothetical protein
MWGRQRRLLPGVSPAERKVCPSPCVPARGQSTAGSSANHPIPGRVEISLAAITPRQTHLRLAPHHWLSAIVTSNSFQNSIVLVHGKRKRGLPIDSSATIKYKRMTLRLIGGIVLCFVTRLVGYICYLLNRRDFDCSLVWPSLRLPGCVSVHNGARLQADLSIGARR